VVLERTPAVLDALLRDLPAAWTTARDGAGTWSPHEIVAHLITGERTNWIPRASLILAGDPTATFVPYDRDGYFAEANTIPLSNLLDLFAETRAASLATLDEWRLGDDQLAMRARHPVFGEVTLRQLLATWVAHDLDHIAQISRTMARRYAEAVGPWSAYMRIVRPHPPEVSTTA
jgi:uncharacterized damage-inducible protein DinB